MTTSPRLPAGFVRRAAGAGAGVAEAELNRMAELALRRDARTFATDSRSGRVVEDQGERVPLA